MTSTRFLSAAAVALLLSAGLCRATAIPVVLDLGPPAEFAPGQVPELRFNVDNLHQPVGDGEIDINLSFLDDNFIRLTVDWAVFPNDNGGIPGSGSPPLWLGKNPFFH
jgi:hypothetical protein